MPLFYIALVLAFLTSLFRYKYIQSSALVFSIPYLAVNIIAESYGIFTDAEDYWIYNLSTIIDFIFYYYVYYRFIGDVLIRKWIRWFSIIYFPFCLLNIFFIQGFYSFHSNSYLAGACFLILLSVVYLRNLIVNIDTQNPFKDRLFWITTGVLFFYIGTFFHLGFFQYIESQYPSLDSVFKQLLRFLNVVLYCMYIIAFNVGNKQ
jgi:hypothetical protein